MSKKNETAFDGVVEDEDKGEDTTEPADESSTEPTEPDSDKTTKNTNNTPESSSTSNTDSEESDPKQSPAFSYDEVQQKPFYIRPQQWSIIEDLRLYTKVALREEHDVRDAQTREIDEAILSKIEDKLQEQSIADEVVKKRNSENTD